jgi:predicted nucleic acid-binding protein
VTIVCLDNHILVWGIREYAEEGQDDMIQRTKSFFEVCQKNKTIMMIPSVVVGEFLTAFDAKHHASVLHALSTSFIIYPYDTKSSAIFAKLWREKKESGLIDKIRKDDTAIKRQELKADCMIVATAIAAQASAIYSYDKGLKKFAGNSINVLDLPEMPYQNELICDI